MADYESDTFWDDVPLNSAVNPNMGLLLFAGTRLHISALFPRTASCSIQGMFYLLIIHQL